MKKHKFAVLSVCVIFVILIAAGFASAKDDPRLTPRPKVGKPMPQDIRSIRPSADTGQRNRTRLRRIEQGIEQRHKQQQQVIIELRAIKKLALKEKATETAKRLEILIKQHEAKAAKTIDTARESRDRQRGRTAERPAPAAVLKETPKEEVVKKAKWWQIWK
ncbi:MAG: hypothetical protein KAJ07_07315 [Planctomycetes bacterium]|nr:hypothetical protein [Planctomycetota bacterium]